MSNPELERLKREAQERQQARNREAAELEKSLAAARSKEWAAKVQRIENLLRRMLSPTVYEAVQSRISGITEGGGTFSYNTLENSETYMVVSIQGKDGSKHKLVVRNDGRVEIHTAGSQVSSSLGLEEYLLLYVL
ncbi:MAG TPA: hypothetical protein VF120_01695 [Ktedonobacterales bacterium]